MADPVIVKVSDLAELTDLASGDLLTVVDISELVVSAKTKKLQAQSVKIFNSNQLSANVVTNSAIADGAVTSGKLGAGAVTAGKIATGGVSTSAQLAAQVVDTASLKNANVTLGKMAANSIDSDQYVDGSIDTVHLANDAVTEDKLGAIKRTVTIPLFGWEDVVTAYTFTNVIRWPTMLDGHIVTGARAVVHKAVSSSGNITLTITNAGGTMSTITITAGSVAGTSTIATAYKAASEDEPVTVVVAYGGNTANGLTLYLEVTG